MGELMQYNYRRREEAPHKYRFEDVNMLKTWLLVAWVGTNSNFMIVHESFAYESCIEERKVWQLILKREIKLECVQDLKEGRSLYPKRFGSRGLVK